MGQFQPYRIVTSAISNAAIWPPSVGDRPFSIHGVDLPLPGYHKVHLVKGGPWVPLRVWIVEHRFPSGALAADVEFMGQRGLDQPSSCWEWRFKDLGLDLTRIARDEYDYLIAMMRHAIEREPDLAEANPHQPINFMKQPTIF